MANMEEFGDFFLTYGDPELQQIVDFGTDLDEYLGNDIQVSEVTNVSELQEMLDAFGQSAIPDLPRPETPSAPTTVPQQMKDYAQEKQGRKRFRDVSDEKLTEYKNMNQSKSTKFNTKWGLNILQDWHNEKYGCNMDTENIPKTELADKLSKFYAEIKPQPPKSKKMKSETESEGTLTDKSEDYGKNSMKNIRGAINRHFHKDLKRGFDIIHDSDFSFANETLNGILKERVATGKSKPTKHKTIITPHDLNKISTYFSDAARNPLVLRQCLWYNISIHFITRGLEFHRQLNIDSLKISLDENDVEYVTLTHETQQKNYQGGLTNSEEIFDKRMYATGSDSCPVKMLRLFLQKTDKKAGSLFNKCIPEAIKSPHLHNIWYSSEALGKHSFKCFMPDISKGAQCTNRYTAHCVRATCIQSLSDAGVETRKIMFYSGHRNEASVRSYSRDISTAQKQSISSLLANTADTSTPAMPLITTDNNPSTFPPTAGLITNTHVNPQVDFSVMPSMLTNSSFNNCSFNFNMKM